jgi:hypothetical protein
MTLAAAHETLESYHDFYVASGGIAGALIGLLFVAISVARERELPPAEAAIHELRMAAAFTAFTNALVVSLFGLMPTASIGTTAIVVSCIGLLAMSRSALVVIRLERAHQRANARDGMFVAVMTLWFIGQLAAGISIDVGHGDHGDALQWIAILVVVFFLTGIARAWQLIGGPQFTLREEASKLIAESRRHPD